MNGHDRRGVPGFLPLGRHCDYSKLSSQDYQALARPRISAPGQALRSMLTRFMPETFPVVPGFLPLGRHCDGYHRSAFIFGRLYRSLRASLSVRITPPMGLSEVPDFTDTSSGMTSGTTWPLATRFSMLTTLFPS